MFPRLVAAQGADALRRVQAKLLVAITRASIPLHVSFGVTDSYQASSLDELLRVADHNLFRAKRDGRNRVALDSAVVAETMPTAAIISGSRSTGLE